MSDGLHGPRSGPDNTCRHHLLAKRVRTLRVGKNWPRERLADESGTDRTTVSRLERAHGGTTVDTLWAVADAFGLPAADLLGDDVGQTTS